MKYNKLERDKIIIAVVIFFIIFLVVLLIIPWLKSTQPKTNNQNQQSENNLTSGTFDTSTVPAVATSTANNLNIYLPLTEALTRVTKKPFGLYVSPKNSPVSPERFSGYHTGVDFETKPEEQDIDVPVYAICSGPLILKKIATGYGGVAVQSCEINKEPVTIIYGHLRLASITSQKTSLNQGQQIGLLGYGYSTETAGERKHLHLGIHKGKTVSLLGYVQNKSDLSQWIDFLTLVK